MPQLTIPLRSKIDETDHNKIEIRIRNTNFWIIGIKKENHLWDAYLANESIRYKEILRKDVTTKSFALFSNIILKTPFPYSGKRAEDPTIIIKFVKKTIKKTWKQTTHSAQKSQNSR